MIGYCNNIKSKGVLTCTSALFHEAIASPQVKAICAEIADALEKVKRGEMSREDFETFKAEHKKRLPIITPHATFKNGERKNKDAVPSGLSMFDIDHMEGSPRIFFEEQVKPHLEALGILLAHVTPSAEGLRLVFVMPEGMTIAQAQAWMAKQLGLKSYDISTKDYARSSFLVPEEYILHLDDRLFSETASPPTPLQGEGSKMSQGANSNEQETQARATNLGEQETQASPANHSPLLGEGSGVRLLSFKGIPFSTIISRYWDKTGGEPVEGERNVRLYQLAANLRAICDNSPLQLMQVMPRYGLSEGELESIVRSACKEPVKGSKIIKEIITSLTPDPSPRGRGVDTLEGEDCGEGENSPGSISLPSLLGRGKGVRLLPPALRSSLAGIPDTLHFPVMASVMPIAAALADQVEVEYCDGVRQRLSLMSIILGDQASGKSLCKQVVDIWKRTLEREDAQARKTEDEWKQKKKNRKANERCPEDPGVMIRVLPVTVSCSTLLRRFKNSRDHTLYSFGEELDTLRKTNGAGSWSSKYDIYRLAFDHGEWGQDYNSDQAESGTVNVAYNWTMLGTYGAMRRCFKRDNVENGLSSRVMVAEMPDNSFAPMPHYGQRTALDEAKIEQGVQMLRSRTGFIDTPRLRKAIGEWVEQKRIEALSEIDRVKDTYRKRAAVIGFRCGVVCHLLSGEEKETKATLQFATAMAELTLQGQMRIFGDDLRAQLEEGSPRDNQRTGCNKSIFEQLPPVFTMDDLSQLKGGNTTASALRVVVHRWSRAKWIEKSDGIHWKKI